VAPPPLPLQVADDNGVVVATSARHRYAGMPSAGRADGAFYFSWEAGPAHFISVSSFYPGHFGPASPMTVWLQADLAAVNRTRTPWTFVILHAPWYNSNTAHQGEGEAMRVAYEVRARVATFGKSSVQTGARGISARPVRHEVATISRTGVAAKEICRVARAGKASPVRLRRFSQPRAITCT
jgi:hypothetical protein